MSQKKDNHGYISLPRSLFVSEAWRKASGDQAKAFIDLYNKVPKVPYEYNTTGGTYHLKKGQFVASYARLAELWNCSASKARRIVSYLVSANLVSRTLIEFMPAKVQAKDPTNPKVPINLLTVNCLCDDKNESATKGPTNQPAIDLNKINNNIINPPNPPSGADSSLDSSPDFPSEEVERCKAEANELNKRLSAAWQKIMKEKIWPNEYHQYMPERRAGLCNGIGRKENIKNDLQIPAIRTLDQRQAHYFIEYHLCDFINSRSFRHVLSVHDIDNIASRLLSRSADLTIAQIPLFFHLLDRNDRIVGPPEWNGTLTADLITTAFSKYLEWLKG